MRPEELYPGIVIVDNRTNMTFRYVGKVHGGTYFFYIEGEVWIGASLFSEEELHNYSPSYKYELPISLENK